MRACARVLLTTLLLLIPSLASAQPKLAPSILDRPPALVSSETSISFGTGKPGILSQVSPVTGFAFGPGRDEVAFCAPAADGRSALWVAAAAFPPEPPPSGKPFEKLTREEILPYRVPTTPPRVLWTAPAGRTLRGPIWWSPNGSRLLVRECEGERADLVSVDYVTGGVVRVTQGAKVTAAAWSPEGQRVAYIASGQTGPEVWLQTLPPGEAKRLGEGGLDLGWSVEGRTLRWMQPGKDVWTQFEWDGEKVAPVGQLPPRPEGALWSPDGRLCAALEGDPKQLVVYPTSATAGETIPLPGVNPRALLGWSPDSRLILVVGERNQPVAVSVPKESEMRDDVRRVMLLEKLAFADTRAAVIGPPMDVEAGLPSWSSRGDLVSYVWSSDRADSIFLWNMRGFPGPEHMAEDMARRGLLPTSPALIVLPIQRRYMDPQELARDLEQAERRQTEDNPTNPEALRIKLLSNVKNITMALQMYLTDYDAFPNVTNLAGLRKTLSEYLKNDSLWLMPGTKDVVVKSLVPPGMKLSEVEDPANLPVIVIDVLPDWDLVGFADGHAKAFPKGSDWGQASIPQ